MGIRAGTRRLLSCPFRKRGVVSTSKYMHVYKRGDYVDIKADPRIQKGMPHKFYHGKTGKVFNVARRALGVIVNKRVRQRIIAKKISVRIEHVKPSKCREDFIARVKLNQKLIEEAKKNKLPKPQLKRQAVQPKEGFFVRTDANKPQQIEAIPYEFII
ncbi:60S ribosomal protein L21 [Patella vulgata]|uniref:60S ribosomal protein L21 n=1 Tax=Patella vulgata TaxID=6465 RepID=UPI0021802B99|nr:60S ribosomal protein L21 [Patella vulgata]